MNIQIIWNMLIAIAWFEGYFSEGSRARRNNNPGNLRGWDPNLPKDDAGFDIFPSIDKGVEALWRQIWKNINRGLTLREFFEGKPGIYPGYAPLSDGNSKLYARTVSQYTGIPIDNVTIQSHITT